MGEERATLADQWGHPVRTTSDACVSAINSYYRQVLSYGRDRKVILQALLHDPDCVLGNALAAFFVSSQEPSRAPSYLAAAAAHLEDSTSYEKAVFRSVSCLLADERDDEAALNLHSEILKEFPRDLVTLKRAQILCFYIGRPDISLDLVQQVLPQNEEESYIYGMLAFPLLELGRMADAEKAATKGFDINKHDFWSQHALCHVLQYDCRFKEAVEFMELCSPSWSSCSSFMYTHNWWHIAICYLEGHSPLQKVLEVYDCNIWRELEKDDADRGEVYLNALGLLLRIFVRGQMGCIEDRVRLLADIFTEESNWHREWLLDLLAVWALASTDKINKAEVLLQSMKSRKKQHPMQRGIVLAEAMFEYGRGNHQKVFDMIGPNFDANDCKMIGASDEQLDVFNEVWYDVLLNTGHVSEAIEEIEKRVRKREGAPFLWHLLGKAYSMEGRADASIAVAKATSLEASYFN